MATFEQIVNSDKFKNAAPEKQAKFLRAVGLTTQDVFAAQESDTYAVPEDVRQGYIESMTSLKSPEPTFGDKMSRAAGRGVVAVAAIPQEVQQGIAIQNRFDESSGNPSIYGREATTGLEKGVEWFGNNILTNDVTRGAIKVGQEAIDYWGNASKAYAKRNPSLITDKDGLGTKIAGGALESMPTSMAMMGATALTGGVGSYGTMYYQAIAQNYENDIKALEAKGIKYDPQSVYNAAVAKAHSEAMTEVGSDLVSLGIGKAIAKPIMESGAKTATEVFNALFKNSSLGVKKVGTALGTSAVAETSSEVANLGIQQSINPSIGLENEFGKNVAQTAGTALLMSIPMTGGGVILGKQSANADTQARVATLFKGLDSETVSKMTPIEIEAYAKSRMDTAASLVPIIKENLGKEAADNFINNVGEATINAATPEVANEGHLPMNESIFTDKPVFTEAIPIGKSGDIDVLNTTSTTDTTEDPAITIANWKKEQAVAEQNANPNREVVDTSRPLTNPVNTAIAQSEESQQQINPEQQRQEAMQAQQAAQQKQDALSKLKDMNKVTNTSTGVVYKPTVNKDGSVTVRHISHGGKLDTNKTFSNPVEAYAYMEDKVNIATTELENEAVTKEELAKKKLEAVVAKGRVAKQKPNAAQSTGTQLVSEQATNTPVTTPEAVANSPANTAVVPEQETPMSDDDLMMQIATTTPISMEVGSKDSAGVWSSNKMDVSAMQAMQETNTKLEELTEVLACLKK
jgi:hypothetical protein